MSSFSATASKNGIAHTNTDPSFLVTSSASATATSNESQSNAQTVANTIALDFSKAFPALVNTNVYPAQIGNIPLVILIYNFCQTCD